MPVPLITTKYYNTFKQKVLKGEFDATLNLVACVLMSGTTTTWTVATLSTYSQIVADIVPGSDIFVGSSSVAITGLVTQVDNLKSYIYENTLTQAPVTGIVFYSGNDLICYNTYSATVWSNTVYIPTMLMQPSIKLTIA